VSRYRCTHCGNLTRFDITRTQRTRAFYHYSVGGELEVEDAEVLDDRIEEVACRWCGSGEHVEEISDEAVAEDAVPEDA
jgi:DNA-directed RNA polymerase subunit RPC12/RpoP